MHHVLAVFLAVNYNPRGPDPVLRRTPSTLLCAIVPSWEAPTFQRGLASSKLSALSRSNIYNNHRRPNTGRKLTKSM